MYPTAKPGLLGENLTCIATETIAAIRFHLVDTSGVVHALVVHAVVNVILAAISFIAGRTVTANEAYNVITFKCFSHPL